MKSSLHRIFTNTLYANISTVITRIVGLLVSIILARHLGVTQFGQLAVFFSVSSVFFTLSDAGILQFVIREVARDRQSLSEWFHKSLVLKSAIMLPAATVLAAIFSMLGVAVATRIVLISGLCFALGKAYYATVDSFFISQQNVKVSLVCEFIFSSVVLLIILILRHFGFLNIISTLLSYILSIFLIFLLSFLWFIKRYNIFLSLKLKKPDWSILKESYHFLMASVAILLFSQIDIIFLRIIHGPSFTGYYNAALSIYSGIIFLIANLSRVLFPVFSNLYKSSLNDFSDQATKILRIILVFVLPLSAGGVIVSKPVVQIFFGNNYLPSVPALAFLMIAYGMQFLGTYLTLLLQSAQFHKYVAKINWLAVCLNVTAGFALIYLYNYTGAGISRLITNLFILLSCWYVLNKKLKPLRISNQIYKSLLAVAVMSVFLVVGRRLHIAVLIPSGAVIYLLAMICLKGFSGDEYKYFSSIFKNISGEQSTDTI